MSRFEHFTALLAITLLAGCGPSLQQLSVETTPPGAEITLTRFGVTEFEGGVGGSGVGGIEDEFEEEPFYLGTSPLTYEFDLEEDERRISVGGFSAAAVRRYTEGIVRAERNGAVAERRVRFTGEPISLELLLQDR